jgi:DHA3 family tetracycline resistance protein-like MFS transporter
LATVRLALPFVLSGIGEIGLAALLLLWMPEHNFVPQRVKGTKIRASFVAQWKQGVGAVKGRPVLMLIFAIAAMQGASTEGFDRLFALHFLRGTHIPSLGSVDRVAWWGIITAGGLFLSIGATEFVKRRVTISNHIGAARALALINLLLIGTVVLFGLAPAFWLALAAYWATGLLRRVNEPIFTTWVNQGLDPSSRATVNSMWGQADALGQVAGGPILGVIAAARSVTTAIVVSGFLRAPALWLFGKTLRGGPLSAEDLGPDPSQSDEGSRILEGKV